MKLFSPSNIFTEILSQSLSSDLSGQIIFKPSSLITSEIKNHIKSIGLIPTMDLLKNDDLYVSKEHGISFESSLCNSYIYFKPEQKDIIEFSLFGDISSLEVILSKILFKEIYNSEIKIEILTNEQKLQNKNLVITGDKNFEDERFVSGISFSEEIIESLSLPFVNYVFASTDKEIIEDFNEKLIGISNLVYTNVEDYKFGKNLSNRAKEYIKSNISSLILDFEISDIEGINQLLRLPYYHGIVNDIIEVKFV
jgi:hypothetical protein